MVTVRQGKWALSVVTDGDATSNEAVSQCLSIQKCTRGCLEKGIWMALAHSHGPEMPPRISASCLQRSLSITWLDRPQISQGPDMSGTKGAVIPHGQKSC